MNLIRSYKLQLLGITIKPLEEEIILFLDSKFKGLKVLKYPKTTYYFNNNQCIFELDNNHSLNLRYDGLVETLHDKYLLDGDTIKDTCAYFVSTIYHVKVYSVYQMYKHSVKFSEKEYLQKLNERNQIL